MLLRDLIVEVRVEDDDGWAFYRAKMLDLNGDRATVIFLNRRGGPKNVSITDIRMQPKYVANSEDYEDVFDIERCDDDDAGDGWYVEEIDCVSYTRWGRIDGVYTADSDSDDGEYLTLDEIRLVNPNPTWNINNFKHAEIRVSDLWFDSFLRDEFIDDFCLEAGAFYAKLNRSTAILDVIFYNKRAIIPEWMRELYAAPAPTTPRPRPVATPQIPVATAQIPVATPSVSQHLPASALATPPSPVAPPSSASPPPLSLALFPPLLPLSEPPLALPAWTPAPPPPPVAPATPSTSAIAPAPPTGQQLSSPADFPSITTTLLGDLECPVCMNYMQPPIMMCVTGHSLCQGCQRRLKHCPICQQGFSTTRNFTLESMADKLGAYQPLPQKVAPPVQSQAPTDLVAALNAAFTTLNASVTTLIAAVGPPTAVVGPPTAVVATPTAVVAPTVVVGAPTAVVAAPTVAPTTPTYKCHVLACNWSGEKAQLIAHWCAHTNRSLHLETTALCLELGAQMGEPHIIRAWDEYFWYKHKVTPTAVLWSVQYIGPAHNAAKYTYEIGLGRRKSQVVRGQCQSLNLTDEELFANNERHCLYVSIDAVRKYVNNNQFHYTLNIKNSD